MTRMAGTAAEEAQRRRDLITFRRTDGGGTGGEEWAGVSPDGRRGADRRRLS